MSPDVLQIKSSQSVDIDIPITEVTSKSSEVQEEGTESQTDGVIQSRHGIKSLGTSLSVDELTNFDIEVTANRKDSSISEDNIKVEGQNNKSVTEMKPIARRSSSPPSMSFTSPGNHPQPSSFIQRSLSNASSSGISIYRFTWSPIHQQLLGNLLNCILPHLESWKQYCSTFSGNNTA